MARLVPGTCFAELQIPLTITTTDLDSGELVLFGALGQDGPLVDALYASCALPLYFPPQSIGGRRLGDGGLRAVLGLDAVRRVPADLVGAVDGGPGRPWGASGPIWWWRWRWARGSTSRGRRSGPPSRRSCGRTARRSAS